MDDPGASLWLRLLLGLMTLCHSDADQNHSSAPAAEPELTASDHANTFSTNGSRLDCLIDTEMGLIAVGSAGGLILCLLVATVVLACQVCHIQRQVYAPRTSRSNMYLVGGAGYWDTEQPEGGGLLGPCDNSVVLEEVRADGKMEEVEEEEEEEAAEIQGEGGGAEREEGASAGAFGSDGKDSHMQSFESKDACLQVPKNVEDMPLVV